MAMFHSPPFSAILASFWLKMVVFGADFEVRSAQYSNYNRNVPIPLKMRGLTTYGDVPFLRYAIFLHFQPF